MYPDSALLCSSMALATSSWLDGFGAYPAFTGVGTGASELPVPPPTNGRVQKAEQNQCPNQHEANGGILVDLIHGIDGLK